MFIDSLRDYLRCTLHVGINKTNHSKFCHCLSAEYLICTVPICHASLALLMNTVTQQCSTLKAIFRLWARDVCFFSYVWYNVFMNFLCQQRAKEIACMMIHRIELWCCKIETQTMFIQQKSIEVQYQGYMSFMNILITIHYWTEWIVCTLWDLHWDRI